MALAIGVLEQQLNELIGRYDIACPLFLCAARQHWDALDHIGKPLSHGFELKLRWIVGRNTKRIG